MLRIEKALLTGLIVSLALVMCGFSGQRDDISDKILRLHVIANSDTAEDQRIKLKVRDRLLQESSTLFSENTDKTLAEKQMQENLPLLRKTAEDEIRKLGYDYTVEVGMGQTHFNTRVYDEVTLPAGTYDALTVTIGEGKGKNWWCVMFPPMCLPAAEEKQALSDVLTEEELETIEGEQGYEVRFKLLDMYEEFMQWIHDS